MTEPPDSADSSTDLSAVLAGTTDVILVLDANGRYLEVAPNDNALLYKPPAELIGRSLNQIFPPKQADFFYEQVRRAIDMGRAHRVEYSLEIAGREARFDATVSPLSPDSVLWMARDITPEREAQQKLQRQLQFTQAITGNLGEGLYAIDPHGRVTFINPAGEALLGWKESELLGRDMHGIVHSTRADGTYRPASECPLLGVLKSGQTVKVESDVFTRRDGTLLPIAYTASPITTDGQIVGAVLVFSDISERIHLEEQLRQAQKMEAIGQLAGGVAHDFNNLLTIINGYTELLLSQSENGLLCHRELREIRKAGERATLLTQRLLAFSRRQMLQPRLVALNGIVSGFESILRRLIPENINVAIRLDPRAGHIEVDPCQIEQAILNLAVNARDAMPQGGQLTIETSSVEVDDECIKSHPDVKRGGYGLLTVTDTGTGIHEEIKGRIFEPFFTTKETGKGTGLGLSMVYGVVKQSGGHICVYSEKNLGTTFKIYFPLLPAPAHGTVASRHEGAAPGGTETVLLLEDDPGVREYAKAVLERQGYSVIAAGNADQALAAALAFSGKLHLMITDVVMPGKSGPEVAQQLASMGIQPKVLYMSGYTDDAIVRHGILPPGLAFLAKPFSPEALVRKVWEVLHPPDKKRLILIVDDEPAIRALLRDVLSRDGYDAAEACDGKEALRKCLATPPDLIITDLCMPECDGLEALRTIRRTFPQIRVVAMSGMTGHATFLRTARLFGAAASLRKPLDLIEVSKTIRGLL
jgi:two-component system cell cycle sensor histidine kinase/response regulator CckA